VIRKTNVGKNAHNSAVVHITEKMTLMALREGCPQMTNLDGGSTLPVPRLLLHLRPLIHCQGGDGHTCCTVTNDSHEPHTMPACHTPPTRGRGMAASVSEVGSSTPGDTVHQ